MSTTPTRHGRTSPLQKLSESQNTTPGIRIVPYSPPRISSGASDEAGLSRPTSRVAGNYSEAGQTISNAPDSNWEVEWKEGYASNRPVSAGSAASSPTSSTLSLVVYRDARVSDRKPAPGSSDRASRVGSDSSLSADQGSKAAAGPAHRPLSRRRNHLTVNPDGKTFSLVPSGTGADARTSDVSVSTRSPPMSYSTYSSRTSVTFNQQRSSVSSWGDDQRAASPANTASTIIPEHAQLAPASAPASSTSSKSSLTAPQGGDNPAASPWNHRLVGGLRQVPASSSSLSDSGSNSQVDESPLAPLPEFPSGQGDGNARGQDLSDLPRPDTSSRDLLPKASFASEITTSTTGSDNTNYKVYSHGLPPQNSTDSLVHSPPVHPNREIVSTSSPLASPQQTPPGSSAGSSGGEQNYVVHGNPSPQSAVLAERQPRPAYSQESLVVPPPIRSRKRSTEAFGYFKQRSRESLGARAGSLRSIQSFQSLIALDPVPATALAAPLFANIGSTASRSARGDDPGNARPSAQDSWSAIAEAGPSGEPGLAVGPSKLPVPFGRTGTSGPPRLVAGSSRNQLIPLAPRFAVPMMEAHPHVWSSQLSTVMSESEPDSEPPPTGSGSMLSRRSSGQAHGRQHSPGSTSSFHGRHISSVSSSLAAQESPLSASDSRSRSQSTSDSFDRPQPTYGRGPMPSRMVRHLDEHGDGLADLEHQPSSSALSAFYTSSGSSNCPLSPASSRGNSLTAASIPAWARLYYGSGERRWLGSRQVSLSTLSDAGDSRPRSANLQSSSSPSLSNFPLSVYSPRRRGKQAERRVVQEPFSSSAEAEIKPVHLNAGIVQTLRKKTSSLWSPHLGTDRRASRYSIWEPPSMTWSTDSGGAFGRRNIQVVLFSLGFVFPFAWIIAALLPLPSNPKTEELEEEPDNSAGRTRTHHMRVMDEKKFESASWWRNLNRIMSFVGLFIIGVVVALAVVGSRQGWA